MLQKMEIIDVIIVAKQVNQINKLVSEWLEM